MYIYTGIAFFRQLPEGVPGAYRLFVTFLALPVRRVDSAWRVTIYLSLNF